MSHTYFCLQRIRPKQIFCNFFGKTAPYINMQSSTYMQSRLLLICQSLVNMLQIFSVLYSWSYFAILFFAVDIRLAARSPFLWIFVRQSPHKLTSNSHKGEFLVSLRWARVGASEASVPPNPSSPQTHQKLTFIQSVEDIIIIHGQTKR